MGRRVFLDVGGHTGETLVEVMKDRWEFDRIWSFEPVSICITKLESIADERTTFVPAGLWSSDTEMDIHDPGTVHASVDAAAARFGEIERARFIDAATWMATHITSDDTVWMKINVEASEVEVLRRLIETGEIAKVDHLVVHFDVEKVGRGSEAVMMRKQLNTAGVSWREATSVMFGRTREVKTATWLAWTEGRQWEYFRRKVVHQARRRVFLIRRQLKPSAG